MNQKSGSTAKEEIRAAMNGLVHAAAKAEAVRLADIHNLSVPYIYEITADLRPRRKKRSDAGTRKYEFAEGTDTWEAAKLVIGAKLDPDQALLTVKANGHTNVPALGYFQKMLRESEIDRKRLRSGRRNHRRHEAEAPLDRVQIDSSALKVRWLDYKTRRIVKIEGIDKNHPQLDATKIQVWQIVAVDDHSRRRFVKYLPTHHIQSRDMVVFFCDLCVAWGGVPRVIYTDNGPEFNRFFAQAVKILSSLLKDMGGFEHEQHAPLNAQATGKVEVAHQWVEKMNKYIGLAQVRGIDVTLDHLQPFADAICRDYNEVQVHRSTGQSPAARWFGTQMLARVLPAETIKAALLFENGDRRITSEMTVEIGKIKYRLPVRHPETGELSGLKAGMKVHVVVPDMLDEIFITLPNGGELAVNKDIATPDVAGQVKSPQPSQGELITKRLAEEFKADNKAAKELKKLTGETYQVPFLNHEIEVPQTNVHHFPHPSIAVTAEQVADATPVPMDEVTGTQAPSPALDSATSKTSRTSRTSQTYSGRPLTFWDALGEFKDRFASITEAKDFLMTLFPNTEGTRPVTEVEAAIDTHFNPQQEAAAIRLAS